MNPRLILTFVFLTMVLGAAIPAIEKADAPRGSAAAPYVADEVLVRFTPGADPADVALARRGVPRPEPGTAVSASGKQLQLGGRRSGTTVEVKRVHTLGSAACATSRRGAIGRSRSAEAPGGEPRPGFLGDRLS